MYYLGVLLKDRAKADNRDYSHLHPSEIGGCPRANMFKILGIEENSDFSVSTLLKFDNGHSLHDRIQKYFRDIGKINSNCGLVVDTIEKIENGHSEVAFQFSEDGDRIPTEKIIVYGTSGRKYPFNPNHKVWIADAHNSIELAKFLNVGDKFYLTEVPFEDAEMHLSGHVDGVIKENGHEAVLEIKSINAKGFTRLFYNDDLKYDYQTDGRDEKKCHICSKSTRAGENMAMHLMGSHSELANAQKKHVIQANAYMEAMGVDRTLFWYENKDNQEICDIIEYRNDKIVKEIKTSCIKLWNMIEQTWDGNPQIPVMPTWAKADAFGCKWCSFHHMCWKNDSMNIYKAIENMISMGKLC